MYAIGFEKWDLLLIRFKDSEKLNIGYIRYFLRENLKHTEFNSREEAEKVLSIIKKTNIEFVNDSINKSIINGENIDKNKLKIFNLRED